MGMLNMTLEMLRCSVRKDRSRGGHHALLPPLLQAVHPPIPPIDIESVPPVVRSWL